MVVRQNDENFLHIDENIFTRQFTQKNQSCFSDNADFNLQHIHEKQHQNRSPFGENDKICELIVKFPKKALDKFLPPLYNIIEP